VVLARRQPAGMQLQERIGVLKAIGTGACMKSSIWWKQPAELLESRNLNAREWPAGALTHIH